MSDTYTLNVTGLETMLHLLKSSKPPVARVGILGSKDARSSENGPGNAEIGAAHEYGAPARGLPQRSFLRMPISTKLDKYMSEANLFHDDELKAVLAQKSLVPWLKKVAIVAERCVAEAFASGGFGLWPKWKNPDYTNNANMLLVDTTQLRNSITSEVKA